MAREIGPREKALREARERRFEESQKASVAELREKVAGVKLKPRKAKKGKKRG